jgi:predicted NUDIX family NTP pyrophosphohydrolase
MPKTSAGLLLYRQTSGRLEVLLVHPGGPLWGHRDAGAWSIPKGELDPGEDPLAAAQREFQEETGVAIEGPFEPLDPVQMRSGKIVRAWAVRADLDASACVSNTFDLEWPPRSGQVQAFPEVDRAEWFDLTVAKEKILPGQLPLLEELERREGT